MRAMSRAGRRYGLLIAFAALGFAGCTDDVEPPPQLAARALPTSIPGLPPVRTAIPRAAPAPAQAVQTARAGGALGLAPAAVQPQSGHAYWARLPDEWLPFASDHADPKRSTLVVEEDGVPLAPGNAPLETVQKVGRGSFLHWGVWLYFSSSDNSDPRSNGREYRAVLVRTE